MTKKRIIINNKSSLSDFDSLERVNSVIKMGKISKYNGINGYCFVSAFDDCYVNCDLTYSGTHSFTLTNR